MCSSISHKYIYRYGVRTSVVATIDRRDVLGLNDPVRCRCRGQVWPGAIVHGLQMVALHNGGDCMQTELLTNAQKVAKTVALSVQPSYTYMWGPCSLSGRF